MEKMNNNEILTIAVSPMYSDEIRRQLTKSFDKMKTIKEKKELIENTSNRPRKYNKKNRTYTCLRCKSKIIFDDLVMVKHPSKKCSYLCKICAAKREQNIIDWANGIKRITSNKQIVQCRKCKNSFDKKYLTQFRSSKQPFYVCGECIKTHQPKVNP